MPSLWNRAQIWLYHSNGSHQAQNYFWKAQWILDPGRPGLCLLLPTGSLHAPRLTHPPCLFPCLPSQLYTAFLKIFIWLHGGLVLQHVRFLVVACELLVAACGIWFPDQESKPGPRIGNVESQSLDHQVSPYTAFKALMTTVLLLVAMATLHSGDPSKFLPKRMSMQLFSQGENKSYLY